MFLKIFGALSIKKMSRALLFLPLLGICLATPFEFEPLSDAHIFHINTVQSSWKAGRNFNPDEFDRVKGLLGVDMESNKLVIKEIPESNAVVRENLPKEFDPRKKWPNCKKSLNEIRDQSDCGSCWAFGSSEAMTDRVCIHTKKDVHISSEDINDCCYACGFGCQGGYPSKAWSYFAEKGVVSGGNYGTKEGCMPYSLSPCSNSSSTLPDCPWKGYKTPACTSKCEESYGKTYKQDKHFCKDINTFTGEEKMMQEIVDNGPITAAFQVYSDFMSYKSGVYKHVSGQYLGGHAIKILGYGEDNGEKYWEVANSWNTTWGDKGFFKILRGTDECSIESSAVAGIPKA